MGWCIAFVVVDPASAQPMFWYRPLNGSVAIPVNIDSQTEHPLDSWGTINYPPGQEDPLWNGRQRIGANVSHRWRIIANPHVRGASFRFARFSLDMNETTLPDGSRGPDRMALSWFYTSPSWQSGSMGVPTSLIMPTATGTGGDSLMFPGGLWRLQTNRPAPRMLESEWESQGYTVDQITLTGNSSQGNQLLPTLVAFDTGLILLQPSGDLVDALLVNTTSNINLATFTHAAASGNGAWLYARCGALPTATSYSTRIHLGGSGTGDRAFVGLASCPSQWNVSVVTENTAGAKAVRFVMGVQRPDQVKWNVSVGFQVPQTAGQLTAWQAAMSAGAMRFHAMMGGSFRVETFRYDNGGGCSCFGGGCDVCIRPSCSQSTVMLDAWFILRMNLNICGGTPPLGAAAIDNFASLYAHEAGHQLVNMVAPNGDEYDGNCGGSINRCNASMMGDRVNNNQRAICTSGSHGTSMDSPDESRNTSDVALLCGAAYGPRTENSKWTDLAGRLTFPFPTYQTPDNSGLVRFANSFELGRVAP